MLRTRLAEARLAILLLSRIPVGRIVDPVPTIGASAWAWPLVGAVIAAPSALVYLFFHIAGLGAQAAALGMITTIALLSGAMHEDGLADMVDGFGGGRDTRRKLEIMRDSRIGSYGVLALIFAVAFQMSLIAELADPSRVILVAVGISMASRSVLPLWLRVMPAARHDGLGQSAAQVPRMAVIISLLLGLLGLLSLGFISALWVAGVMLLCTALVAWLARSQIGGQTGDVIGAMQKLSELTGWALVIALQ